MWSHEELEALSAGYVLMTLEPEEQRAFETHVFSCPSCSQLVVEMTGVTGALNTLVEDRQPPPQLGERILNSIRAETQESGRQAATSLPIRREWWRTFANPRIMAAVIGMLLLAIAGLSFWVVRLDDSLDARNARIARSYKAISIMAKAEQWWRLEQGSSALQARGVLAHSSGQEAACLVLWNLPSTEGMRYNAWVLDGGSHTRIGNMWPLGESLWIIIPGNVDQLDAVTVTLEEMPDPNEPTGPVVARVSLRGD